jgi:hypothetical protein
MRPEGRGSGFVIRATLVRGGPVGGVDFFFEMFAFGNGLGYSRGVDAVRVPGRGAVAGGWGAFWKNLYA